MEAYEKVWAGEPIAYMPAGFDGPQDSPDRALFPADFETAAKKFITSSPDVYCNTTNGEIPAYLEYTKKYFRWREEFTREELEQLINRFPEYSVGEIQNIEPVSRGYSGRIENLKISGSKREIVINKEFNIRKALSPSFLYSSCFIIDIKRGNSGGIEKVTLRGAGWGHGAGLCQIGAAMMAHRGFSAENILYHYYPNSRLASLYKEPLDKEKMLAELSAHDFREGDACYEFFNCYAVAQCPVYLKNKKIVATSKDNDFEFVQVADDKTNLEEMNIDCAFLNFHKEKAIPKK
jgi:peptidoglycan hydrolase-like amidase